MKSTEVNGSALQKEHENVNGNHSTQWKSWKRQFSVLQNII